MDISRNKSHYIIMTVIYNELLDHSIGNEQYFRDANELIEEISETQFDEVDDFIKNSVALSLKNYGKALDAIKPLLVGWEWERIPLLTRAILIMSYTHFYFVEKVDKKVVINIALDLAKKYIDLKQTKFINAILDGVLK